MKGRMRIALVCLLLSLPILGQAKEKLEVKQTYTYMESGQDISFLQEEMTKAGEVYRKVGQKEKIVSKKPILQVKQVRQLEIIPIEEERLPSDSKEIDGKKYSLVDQKIKQETIQRSLDRVEGEEAEDQIVRMVYGKEVILPIVNKPLQKEISFRVENLQAQEFDLEGSTHPIQGDILAYLKDYIPQRKGQQLILKEITWRGQPFLVGDEWVREGIAFVQEIPEKLVYEKEVKIYELTYQHEEVIDWEITKEVTGIYEKKERLPLALLSLGIIALFSSLWLVLLIKKRKNERDI